MSSPTISSANSKAQDSRLFISNFVSGFYKVASVGATTVVLDEHDLNGTGLYAGSTPGQLVIVEGVAASDHGLVADITGITSNTLTVDVDLTTDLADGDIVAVLPPIAAELFSSGGHTLNYQRQLDTEKGLQETFNTHNTPIGVTVGGDVTSFFVFDNEATVRMLLAGVGGYDLSGTGQHDFIPFKSGVSGVEDKSDYTIISKDGNGVVDAAFVGLFGTQMALSVPQSGPATIALTSLGSGYVAEVGGVGKTFTEGANNYIPTASDCGLGDRGTNIGARVQFGGSFGDALTDATDKYIQDMNITVARGSMEDRALGNQFILRPDEMDHDLTITCTRIFENDTVHDLYMGTDAAEPGTPTETRFVAEIFDPAAPTTSKITIDVPRCIVTDYSINRQRGRQTETFTLTALHTLDAENCPDDANPLYRMRFLTPSFNVDAGAAL